MTEEEALKYIETHDMEMIHFLPQDFVVTVKKLIKKQISTNPIIVKGSGYHESEFHDDWWYSCPNCGNDTIDYPDHHCTCGQKLNWEWETV